MTTNKVVAITGASSGMGKATAELFATQNWQVYGGARHTDKIPTGDNIHAIHLDITDHADNRRFIETILKEQGHIDILINNAGYGENGPVEDIAMDKVQKQFATNFFGAAELTQLVLPHMRHQGTGRIVNVSSIGGDIYSPLGAYYHASKAALQQWSDTLDLEVQQFGIRSVIVQPGGTQSAWGATTMANVRQNLRSNSAYTDFATLLGNALQSNSKGMTATSADLAKVIYAAAVDVKPKHRYFNSLTDHLQVTIARTFPVIYRRLLINVLRRSGKQRTK
ncbi:SDR family NAD(P)-dependent oxidoreductase [Furfurilactobacillus siliginis]|uniref:Short-chain dehydrogenase/reductase n=1 Tax=Furfurilactobacillus siliginis TaxID=348151 RepID=A0A0R2L2S0_9LACO|nr:SDR family NAD(P)-dependent oxidoreductase [Furfurilactobacillus siliginis]KRN96047.1 short-chain type dehydrogenase [Furfurilactobacillus siliginis]GEK28753.1 short-chain dehydrogenase/reductase [Furfurilactobacillus siliginis]